MLDLSNPWTRIMLTHIGVMQMENEPEIDKYIDTLVPLISVQPTIGDLNDFDSDSVEIVKEEDPIENPVDIASYIHLSLKDAAAELNVSQSTLGRRWRKLTKKDWPARKINNYRIELKKKRVCQKRIATIHRKLNELLKPKIVDL